MQQDYTIARGRNAMFGSVILKVYFDAFSSKKRRGTTPANIYEQFCYADFIHFSFTGKERDEETGYGYFGARYMDHELMTMWLSVDPMADKYPGISPYNYCMWNPVKLVDPDGREIDDYFTKDGKFLGSDNAETHYVRIIREDCWTSLDKDEHGNALDHDLANLLSTSFSKASENMSEEAQLGVYQHYNLTGQKVEAAPPEEITSKNPMMITKVGCKDGDLKKDIAIVTHLYIPLVNNSTPNSKGDALCDNADEIVNSFVHERDHMQRALKMGYGKWLKMNNSKEGKRDVEFSAIKAQREHSSWSGCRDSFKEGVKRYEERF